MSEHSREQHTSSHHDQEQREHADPGVEASERPAGPDEPSVTGGETEQTVALRDFTAWQGKMLLDRDGEAIGRLEDVYFDTETEQAQFGTVKQGGLLSRRHLTFVPPDRRDGRSRRPPGDRLEGSGEEGSEYRARRRRALPGG